MRKQKEYRAALVFAAALAGSALLPGCVVERHEREGEHVRVPAHQWNDREDLAYRHYLEEQHQDYLDYQRLDAERQRAYWDWRARHPD